MKAHLLLKAPNHVLTTTLAVAILSMTALRAFAQVPGSAAPAPLTVKSNPSTGSANPAAGQPSLPDSKLVPPVWSNTDTQFLKQYPLLEKNVYHEPESHFSFGFSLGLLGFVENRMMFTGNFFQVHYITANLDWEMLNVAYGTTTAQPSSIKSNHFILRTAPKYRLTRKISIGPLLGWEYVSFPAVTAVLYKDGAGETRPEPFSSNGLIYGAELAETFAMDNGWQLRLSQVAYQETYSVTNAGKGWSYLYSDPLLRKDPGPLKAGFVMEFEIGILF